LDNPNHSEDSCTADFGSGIQQDNGIEDLESPEQWDINAVLDVLGLFWPTCKSKRQAEQVLLMVSTMETRRNKGIKNK